MLHTSTFIKTIFVSINISNWNNFYISLGKHLGSRYLEEFFQNLQAFGILLFID